MAKAILVDTTRCSACRGCQVACKQWNDLPAESTTFFGGPGYQNPADLSMHTFRLLRFFVDVWAGNPVPGRDVTLGNKQWNFMSWACLHCQEVGTPPTTGNANPAYKPECKSACDYMGFNAMTIDGATGLVYIDQSLCTGCNSCATPGPWGPGCPFGIPQNGNPGGGPKNFKCHGCWERVAGTYPATATGNTDQYQAGDNDIASKSFFGADLIPACVTACPNDALQYGDRAAVIAEANSRLTDPDVTSKFTNGVYVYGGGGNNVSPTNRQTNVIFVLTESILWYKESADINFI